MKHSVNGWKEINKNEGEFVPRSREEGISWNRELVEKRVGRIYRIGQKRELAESVYYVEKEDYVKVLGPFYELGAFTKWVNWVNLDNWEHWFLWDY